MWTNDPGGSPLPVVGLPGCPDTVGPFGDDVPVTESLHAWRDTMSEARCPMLRAWASSLPSISVAPDPDSLPDPGDVSGIFLHRLDELPGQVADGPAGEQPDGAAANGREPVAKSSPGRASGPRRTALPRTHGVIVLNGSTASGGRCRRQCLCRSSVPPMTRRFRSSIRARRPRIPALAAGARAVSSGASIGAS